MAKISDLIGATLDTITVSGGTDEIIFHARDGRKWRMFHDQDDPECYEFVSIDDICGDITDLLCEPILQAEERSNREISPKDGHDDSWTWTFYELSTIKGSVTIRWYGESNGYYSEEVSFEEIPTAQF